MTGSDYIRPAAAAKRFSVPRSTLADWADAGWIGRARVGRDVFYLASDIAEVIAVNLKPRRVVPIAQATAAPAAGSNWREDPLFKGAAR